MHHCVLNSVVHQKIRMKVYLIMSCQQISLDDNECSAAANALETGVVSCVEAHYEGWLSLVVRVAS